MCPDEFFQFIHARWWAMQCVRVVPWVVHQLNPLKQVGRNELDLKLDMEMIQLPAKGSEKIKDQAVVESYPYPTLCPDISPCSLPSLSVQPTKPFFSRLIQMTYIRSKHTRQRQNITSSDLLFGLVCWTSCPISQSLSFEDNYYDCLLYTSPSPRD